MDPQKPFSSLSSLTISLSELMGQGWSLVLFFSEVTSLWDLISLYSHIQKLWTGPIYHDYENEKNNETILTISIRKMESGFSCRKPEWMNYLTTCSFQQVESSPKRENSMFWFRPANVFDYKSVHATFPRQRQIILDQKSKQASTVEQSKLLNKRNDFAIWSNKRSHHKFSTV